MAQGLLGGVDFRKCTDEGMCGECGCLGDGGGGGGAEDVMIGFGLELVGWSCWFRVGGVSSVGGLSGLGDGDCDGNLNGNLDVDDDGERAGSKRRGKCGN